MNRSFLAFFPYLFMNRVEEIDFGFGKVWNFDLLKEKYIPDKATREHIEKLLKIYKDGKASITGMGIFSIGEINFREFNQEEMGLAHLATNLLFLSFLAKNNTQRAGQNTGWFMGTSDHFDLIQQYFVVGDESISERTGEIIRIHSGGHILSKTAVQKPTFLITRQFFEIDEELLRGLLKLRNCNKKRFERVMEATNIFKGSYYNSYHVSRISRIVLQASAFEILLDLPEGSGKRFFKEEIAKKVNLNNEAEISFKSERKGQNLEDETGTMKVIWGEKFFALRNKIMHRGAPTEEEFYFHNQAHWEIGLLFFVKFIWSEIETYTDMKGDISIRWENLNRFNKSEREVMGFEYDRLTAIFSRLDL